jgi:hypothetical protein
MSYLESVTEKRKEAASGQSLNEINKSIQELTKTLAELVGELHKMTLYSVKSAREQSEKQVKELRLLTDAITKEEKE